MRNKVFCLVVLVCVSPLALGQVNQEIDQDEDLLAVDSIDNEVSFRRPILPPPPSFARVGERLVTAPRAPARRPQGVVRGPQQLTALAGGNRAALVHNSKIQRDGSYAFNYETTDGQRRQESGQPSSSSAGSIVQTGSWSYTGSDGKLYEVQFIADEFGFRPVGDHIHPAHQQAQRQARLLAGQRHVRAQRAEPARTRQQELRTRGQEGRTRGQEGRIRQQETRGRADAVRSRPERQQQRNRRESRFP
eukprot:GFUD01014555.1.p1 GENE.GFUD01014555.1~~GFUD01014555.1.p1  ORF type:complete len:248 (-),score=74.48 GFUD01014555.1:131-874(-)